MTSSEVQQEIGAPEMFRALNALVQDLTAVGVFMTPADRLEVRIDRIAGVMRRALERERRGGVA